MYAGVFDPSSHDFTALGSRWRLAAMAIFLSRAPRPAGSAGMGLGRERTDGSLAPD